MHETKPILGYFACIIVESVRHPGQLSPHRVPRASSSRKHFPVELSDSRTQEWLQIHTQQIALPKGLKQEVDVVQETLGIIDPKSQGLRDDDPTRITPSRSEGDARGRDRSSRILPILSRSNPVLLNLVTAVPLEPPCPNQPPYLFFRLIPVDYFRSISVEPRHYSARGRQQLISILERPSEPDFFEDASKPLRV